MSDSIWPKLYTFPAVNIGERQGTARVASHMVEFPNGGMLLYPDAQGSGPCTVVYSNGESLDLDPVTGEVQTIWVKDLDSPKGGQKKWA